MGLCVCVGMGLCAWFHASPSALIDLFSVVLTAYLSPPLACVIVFAVFRVSFFLHVGWNPVCVGPQFMQNEVRVALVDG